VPRTPTASTTRRNGPLGWTGRFATLVVVLAIVLGAGFAGLVGPGIEPADAATRCGGQVPSAHIRVVVVVDNGVNAPNATCLVVAQGTTGAQLWADRAAVLGTQRPRYADSGLLCAFDGYPASGCGEPSGGGYLYWSYWSGNSGAWVYGGGNPHVRRVNDGDIEGWRFVNGPDSGQNPPPRMAPSRSLFPPIPAPAPAPAPAPTPAPAPAPAPTAPSDPAGAGSPGTGPTAAPTDPGDPAPGATTIDPATGAAIDAVTGEVVDPDAEAIAPDTTTPASTTTADEPSPATELAAGTSSGPSGPDAGAVGGLVVALVLIAALGGAAVVRARTRG
jgi:hypothetical protein